MSSLGINSVFCDPDIALLTSCLKRAVDSSRSRCLLKVGKKESRQLIDDHIVPGVSQIVKGSLEEGHWRDEEECALRKVHCWVFLAWMGTLTGLENVNGTFTPINTTFYVEVVKCLNFEKYMVQCLCRVTEKAMEILTQEIVNCSHGYVEKDDEFFLLKFIEQCMKQQLPNDLERLGNILSMITPGVKCEELQLKIIEKLAQEMRLALKLIQLLEDRNEKDNEEGLKDLGYSVNLFTEKQNVVEFEDNIKLFLNEAKIKTGRFPKLQDQHSEWKPEFNESVHKVILHFACNIQQLITDEWSLLFCWGLDSAGNQVIQGLEQPKWHAVLFNIFTTCLSLQRQLKDNKGEKLQGFVNVLKPYFERQATFEEKAAIDEILSEQEMKKVEKELTASQGESDNLLNQELEKAIFRIQENLLGDEKCFEWLLMTEELYQDRRWLECVLANAMKFVSTTVIKMFIDVLCVLHESASQDDDQRNTYKSLQQVILDLMPCLSLQEQAEVIVYNFEQICVHFTSYTDHSFFFLPNDSSACMSEATGVLLTVTMNKIVNKAEESFSKDVLMGITKGALIAPYVTLKALLTEAIKHIGCEKVICELLQMVREFAGLSSAGDDYLLVRALNELVKTLASKKQEGQFLKLVAALLQPYSHAVLKIKEPPLLDAREILNEIVKPFFITDESSMSPTLVLNVLLTTLSCSTTTPSQQQHWILDEQPFEVLFTLLEMHQDCVHFWQDWVSEGSGEEVMDRDDFALDEAWTEMNVAVKILDEHLIPVLAEAISQEPRRYGNHSEWVESHLDNLDWTATMQLIPLLQESNVMSRGIKLPKSLMHLVTCQLNVLPLDDTESLESFWTMYFKSGALSNEVFGMYSSKLKDHHPKGTAGYDGDCKEIVESLASILPFSTWLQWQRLLNIARGLLNNGYLDLKKQEWSSEFVDLPEADNLDPCIQSTVGISLLLVSLLRCISAKVWATTYVWNTTLKNYASTIKQLSLSIDKPDEFVVTCHLLAHLAYITFKVVPEAFHENMAIVILDVFNACLTTIPSVKDLKPFEYLERIIGTIPRSEFRVTMVNKMQRVVSNIAK